MATGHIFMSDQKSSDALTLAPKPIDSAQQTGNAYNEKEMEMLHDKLKADARREARIKLIESGKKISLRAGKKWRRWMDVTSEIYLEKVNNLEPKVAENFDKYMQRFDEMDPPSEPEQGESSIQKDSVEDSDGGSSPEYMETRVEFTKRNMEIANAMSPEDVKRKVNEYFETKKNKKKKMN